VSAAPVRKRITSLRAAGWTGCRIAAAAHVSPSTVSRVAHPSTRWCSRIIGFHEIPWQYGAPVQTVDQLGKFLSGGCVRQKHEDAVFMWDWSQIGDTVVVTA